jgi:hypothetical protein
MVAGPCGRCARPVVARVAPRRGCRRGALDNEERGAAIGADNERSEGVPVRRTTLPTLTARRCLDAE